VPARATCKSHVRRRGFSNDGKERSEVNSPQPWYRALGTWLWSRPQRWFLFGIPLGGFLAFVVGIAATGGFLGALHLTETNAFCTSCHEMKQPLAELAPKAHGSNVYGIQPGCANCHVPPTFVAGVWRHMKAVVEVWGHVTGKLDTPAKFEAHRPEMAERVWAEFTANDSANCRSCHNPAVMAFKKQPEEAADAHSSLTPGGGVTCIDCHKGIAHTLPKGS
jgi:cytochrome c-type protein NapC